MGNTIERAPRNFGALPDNLSSREASRAVIIPVPYDATSTYVTGSRRGPGAVIDASMNMETFDEELGVETSLIGIHTRDALDVAELPPEKMLDRVEGEVGNALAAGKIPVVLGGEHSVTIGALRAIAKEKVPVSILQLDAHADLRDSYGGTRFSHACVGRRATELGSLVQAGVRSMSTEEAEFLKDSPIQLFPAAGIVSGRIMDDDIVSGLGDRLYVTIDLDVLDPSVMPATGTPEPGGLGWYDVTAILREACRGRTVVGFDVVELCPMPGNVAPDFLAAKLVYRLLGYIFKDDLI